MRTEAIGQDQRDLSEPSHGSEKNEEELKLTPRQFLQLHFITPQVQNKDRFKPNKP